jgi:hypothetical protein
MVEPVVEPYAKNSRLPSPGADQAAGGLGGPPLGLKKFGARHDWPRTLMSEIKVMMMIDPPAGAD